MPLMSSLPGPRLHSTAKVAVRPHVRAAFDACAAGAMGLDFTQVLDALRRLGFAPAKPYRQALLGRFGAYQYGRIPLVDFEGIAAECEREAQRVVASETCWEGWLRSCFGGLIRVGSGVKSEQR